MNCKPGDLAIIIKSLAKNEGKIVEVLHAAGQDPVFKGSICNRGQGFCWFVKSHGTPLYSTWDTALDGAPVPDTWLRPLPPKCLCEDEENAKEREAV